VPEGIAREAMGWVSASEAPPQTAEKSTSAPLGQYWFSPAPGSPPRGLCAVGWSPRGETPSKASENLLQYSRQGP
jgi:hypothetical protein